MRLSAAAAALLASTAVQAFSDSSPFVLLSTAQIPDISKAEQLQTSRQVLDSAKQILGSCPTSRYVVVSQPNLHASDLRDRSGCLAPNLCRARENKKIQGQFSVAEVIGELGIEDVANFIKSACEEKGQDVRVEEHQLSPLPGGIHTSKRAAVMGDNDHELGQIIETVEAAGDYTIVYLSSPHEGKPYESEFIEPVHMELKHRRSAPITIGRRADDERRKPLFEKYQFFTPGIFMGLLGTFVLLSILYVGISALSSLSVSYGAFDKEMGPAAQKKQM